MRVPAATSFPCRRRRWRVSVAVVSAAVVVVSGRRRPRCPASLRSLTAGGGCVCRWPRPLPGRRCFRWFTLSLLVRARLGPCRRGKGACAGGHVLPLPPSSLACCRCFRRRGCCLRSPSSALPCVSEVFAGWGRVRVPVATSSPWPPLFPLVYVVVVGACSLRSLPAGEGCVCRRPRPSPAATVVVVLLLAVFVFAVAVVVSCRRGPRCPVSLRSLPAGGGCVCRWPRPLPAAVVSVGLRCRCWCVLA